MSIADSSRLMIHKKRVENKFRMSTRNRRIRIHLLVIKVRGSLCQACTFIIIRYNIRNDRNDVNWSLSLPLTDHRSLSGET